MRWLVVLVYLLWCLVSCFAQTNASQLTVYLIGDGGKYAYTDSAFVELENQLKMNPRGVVLYLGDNIYQSGLGKSSSDSLKLVAQLGPASIIDGSLILVPGNHDWDMGGGAGLKKVKGQAQFLKLKNDEIKLKNTNLDTLALIPGSGMPGPYSRHLNERVRLVCIDSQWFLHRGLFHKVGRDHRSVNQIKAEFFQDLDSLLNEATVNNELVILAAHHPLFTIGSHSKRRPMGWLRYALPVFWPFLPWLNQLFVQDVPHPRYQRYIKSLLGVLKKYDNVVYVAGHDHNLQYSKLGNLHHIVSGSGSKISNYVTSSYNANVVFPKIKNGNFISAPEKGFAKLVVAGNNKMTLSFYGVKSGKLFEQKLN